MSTYSLISVRHRLVVTLILAAPVASVLAIEGCATSVRCDDTATCAAVGDDSVAAVGDELPDMSDGVADEGDGVGTMGDDTGHEKDAAAAPADASNATADVAVHDGQAEGPDAGADRRADTASDVGGDATRDAVADATCGSNLLTPHAAVALSVNAANVAGFAIDGNFATRSESAQGIDPQWIYLDFGAPVFFDRVRILWEACATNYDLQTSNDAAAWTTMHSIVGNTLSNAGQTTTWTNAVDSTGFTGVGRYLRVFGTLRCTSYGYSIWEMQAYGDANALCHS